MARADALSSQPARLSHGVAFQTRPPIIQKATRFRQLAVGPVPLELFPLPQKGPDPHFGLGRSTYYDMEKRGVLKLARLRKAGNRRGKVLVPYQKALAAIREMANA